MGNCCVGSSTTKKARPNPFAQNAYPSVATQILQNHAETSPIWDKYELGRELGRGQSGVIYLCADKETREPFACKSIRKQKLRSPVDVEDVRREAAIMRHLPAHPNVVRFKGAYEDDDAVHLVMELCEGGELFDRIAARGHYPEQEAARLGRAIVEVVQVCHRRGVMHRDLKPENFLFANENEDSPLKVIDFGMSTFFKPGEKFIDVVGTPHYMAPEMLKGFYGPEVDVWSAGVIVHILLCVVPPFWGKTRQGIAQAILRGVMDLERDPWPQVSESAKTLVRRMLEPDPKSRYNAQQVLDHAWLQNTANSHTKNYAEAEITMELTNSEIISQQA